MQRVTFIVGLVFVIAMAVSGEPEHKPSDERGVRVVSVGDPITIGVGAGQVIARDGSANALWLLGDSETGVARRVTLEGAGWVTTDEVVALTRDDENLASHPTGLALHPARPQFLGDTVNRVGTIYHVSWARAVEDGTLDDAVHNTTVDDAAINGTRPCYVRVGDEWLVATSDYGNAGNFVRLYDPEALARAAFTSEPGVEVHRFPCGPFVQSLCWLDDLGLLVLVQNTTPGLGYRLTFTRFCNGPTLETVAVVDILELTDELEGCARIDGGTFMLLSASSRNNVRIIEFDETDLIRIAD